METNEDEPVRAKGDTPDDSEQRIDCVGVVMNRVRQVVDESADRGSFSSAARRIGIPREEFVRLWTDPAAEPSAELLARVADAYGVPLAWLVSGEA